MTETPAARLVGVTRRYPGGGGVQTVSLAVPAGRITALLGPSGSGKSTILRLIAGLERPDAGEVWLSQRLVARPGLFEPPERRGIGVVFQDYALFPHLSALENVAFGLREPDRAARRETARAWLARVGLAGRGEAYPHALSGGEQQRVALARALAPGPGLVLLDEPFSGLDPGLRVALREATLQALAAAGAAAVFVTHDADEALYVADELIILKDGRIVQAGAPREVYERPNSSDAAAALGPVNVFNGVVRGGAMATPFGPIAAPGFSDGQAAQVLVRAEALRLEPGAGALVTRRRPQGAMESVVITAEGLLWRALVPSGSGPPEGAPAQVRILAAHVIPLAQTSAADAGAAPR